MGAPKALPGERRRLVESHINILWLSRELNSNHAVAGTAWPYFTFHLYSDIRYWLSSIEHVWEYFLYDIFHIAILVLFLFIFLLLLLLLLFPVVIIWPTHWMTACTDFRSILYHLSHLHSYLYCSDFNSHFVHCNLVQHQVFCIYLFTITKCTIPTRDTISACWHQT